MNVNQGIVASVVMAVFNEERFLKEAIASVVAQTEPHWQLVIVDDHSADGSFSIAEEAAAKDGRIVAMMNPGKGKVAAFNAAVARAEGRYVHLFAGDDVLDARCLEMCLRKLQETGLSAVYHELQRVDENLVPLPDKLCGGALAGHTLDEALTKYSYAVPSGLWFFEKAAYPLAWPIPDYVPYEDVWLATCFRAEGRVTYLEDRLYLYRQHANQTYGPSSDVSLERYKFRMARLGKSFESVVNHEIFRPLLRRETVTFCQQQVEFAELLCGQSRSPVRLFRSSIPWKRKLSIATAWYAPWIWVGMRQRALRLTK